MSRAVVVSASGGAEQLQFQPWIVPDPGPGQIRIRQHAVGVNFIDIYQRTGMYPTLTPFVAGNEGAGEVIAVGEGVDDLRPGDRIAYQGAIGAYAEERLLPADKAVPLPDDISYEQAAASMLKGLTAYYLLRRTFPVQPGQTIVFHAAAGGVGLIACQWAKSLGATVIGTVGSEAKMALARANGCNHVVNYREDVLPDRVREITGGAGVEVVYDGNGKDTFEQSLDCLRPLGMMVSFGSASGPVTIANLGILASKGSLFVTRPTSGHYFSTRQELLEGADALFEVIRSGAVKLHIGQSFALKDAAEAHRALENRETTGSTVMLP